MPDSQDVQEALASWTSEELTAAQQPLGSVLDAQRLRIEYAETRRAALGVLAGVVLAAGLAGLIQLAGAEVDYTPALVALLALTGSLTLTGVAALILYGRQTTWAYPFKDDQAETWKWFYRDAIPQARAVVPSLSGRQSDDFRQRSKEAFRASRRDYPLRMLSLADPKVNLIQDLEQVHLLSWNEFYKNRFLEHLRKALIWGVVSSFLLALTTFTAAVIIAACA